MAPTWEKIANVAPTYPQPFKVGNVDCSSESLLCERFGVRGVPTFIYFNDGKMYRYTGQREYSDMMKFGAGDYRKSKEVADIPPPIGDNIITATAFTFQKLIKDLQAMIRFNIYVVLMIFTVGFIVGSMVAMIFAMLTLKGPAFPPEGSHQEESENREIPCEKPATEKKSD
jgi:hypothetical protein